MANKNLNVEILRGYAALIVVISHILSHHIIFDRNFFVKGLIAFDPPAHFSVLIFFVLSGYVIGISQKERLYNKEILIYLKKRLVRILPIYLIAMLIGSVISIEHYSAKEILANFLLLQNIKYHVIWANNPAWSLNYEVIFYILFIPVSFLNIKPLWTALAFVVIGVFNLYVPIRPIITAYSFGFAFWLTGLYLAHNFANVDSEPKMIAMLVYILGLNNIIGSESYNILRLVNLFHPVHPFSGAIWEQTMISIDDLIFIPFCFLLLMFFSGKTFKYKRHMFMALQVIPLIVIILTLINHSRDNLKFYLGILYLAMSTLLYFIKISEQYFRRFGLWLGSISYGIYIIHFPILYLCGRILINEDNVFLYAIRIIVFFGLTISAALFLEKKLQPWIKGKFLKSN